MGLKEERDFLFVENIRQNFIRAAFFKLIRDLTVSKEQAIDILIEAFSQASITSGKTEGYEIREVGKK